MAPHEPRPSSQQARTKPTRRLQWAFRSRETGRFTIVQWPNLPLFIWLVTAATRRLAPVQGGTDAVLHVVGTAALVVWAVGEVFAGVNPWRRLLGFAVLATVIIWALR